MFVFIRPFRVVFSEEKHLNHPRVLFERKIKTLICISRGTLERVPPSSEGILFWSICLFSSQRNTNESLYDCGCIYSLFNISFEKFNLFNRFVDVSTLL